MSDVRQLSGPEIVALMTLYTRVKRGADWCWGDEDGPGLGKVTEEVNEHGMILVEWDNGHKDCYRMGCLGKYDLQLAES